EAVNAAGKRAVAVRPPMPYGDLAAQRVQRYAELADLDRYDCTIEEREEYEPHITSGTVIYAGVDYGEILEQAQTECDVLLWDGGNNDLPFYRPNVWIALVDPLRAGHELRYHPGETNLRAADVVLINKMDSATSEQVAQLEETIAEVNPRATVVKANSRVTCDDPDAVRGARVLVVEDGPTLTHGEMKIGAGVVAAQRLGASEIVDPRPWAIGTIAETFEKYDVGVALGCNALLRRGSEDTYEEMYRAARGAAERIADIAADGWEVVVTHGNGPQVGRILIQQEAAAKQVHPMPLDVCGAESQGQIGYLLQVTIGDVFFERGMERPVVTILTLTR